MEIATPDTTPAATPAVESAPVQTGAALTPQEVVNAMLAEAEAAEAGQIPALPADPNAKPAYKVKVDGEEVVVSIDELLQGYSRQADYTRKTQALKAEQAKFDAQRRALFESDAYKAIEQLANTKLGEFDPYDTDAIYRHFEHIAAKQAHAIYAPVQEALATEVARNAADEFVASKPDFANPEFKQEVAKVLRETEGLDLKTAYLIVKGRWADQAPAPTPAGDPLRDLQLRAASNVGAGTTGQSGGVPAHIIAQGAAAIATYLMHQRGGWDKSTGG